MWNKYGICSQVLIQFLAHWPYWLWAYAIMNHKLGIICLWTHFTWIKYQSTPTLLPNPYPIPPTPPYELPPTHTTYLWSIEVGRGWKTCQKSTPHCQPTCEKKKFWLMDTQLFHLSLMIANSVCLNLLCQLVCTAETIEGTLLTLCMCVDGNYFLVQWWSSMMKI